MSWGAVIAGGAAIVGGAIASKGSKDAASTQAAAAREAGANELAMFERNVELSEPWRQAGIGALSDLTKGTKSGGDFARDFTIADFQSDPGYQFRRDQGLRGVEAGAAARGGALSGGAIKDVVEYGQNFASGEYQNAYNRFNADRDRRFGRLASLAGVGQTATRDVTNQGAQAQANAGNYQTQAANAQAAGTIGQANAWNSTVGTIGNWWQQQRPSGGVGGYGTTGLNNFYFGNGTSGD
jgi:hypothetical protein